VTSGTCPFKVGDTIVYSPTNKGRGSVIMTRLASLEPGRSYKVAAIHNDAYIVVEGFEDAAGGGLYWTEFHAG
jgi:hypothetical protein